MCWGIYIKADYKCWSSNRQCNYHWQSNNINDWHCQKENWKHSWRNNGKQSGIKVSGQTGMEKSIPERRRLCLKLKQLTIRGYRADYSSSQWTEASSEMPVLSIQNWLLSVVLKDENFKFLQFRIREEILLFYNFAETLELF